VYAVKPSSFCFTLDLRTYETCPKDQRNRRHHALQFSGRLKPIHHWHRHIQNNHIGVKLFSFGDRVATILCFTDSPIGLPLVQNCPQAGANGRVVIGDKNTVHISQISAGQPLTFLKLLELPPSSNREKTVR
jgi:hypothetical protein